MTARAAVTYDPHVISNASDVEAAFRAELAQRTETRPWAELVEQAGTQALATLSQNVPSGDVSAAGVLVDDVLYFQSANSRTGAYPYPLEMRHGVFSVTKSSAAALTMLRLAQKYGDQVFDQIRADETAGTEDDDSHVLNDTRGIVVFRDETMTYEPQWYQNEPDASVADAVAV